MPSGQKITIIVFLFFFKSKSVSNIKKKLKVLNFWCSMNYNVRPGFLLHVFYVFF